MKCKIIHFLACLVTFQQHLLHHANVCRYLSYLAHSHSRSSTLCKQTSHPPDPVIRAGGSRPVVSAPAVRYPYFCHCSICTGHRFCASRLSDSACSKLAESTSPKWVALEVCVTRAWNDLADPLLSSVVHVCVWRSTPVSSVRTVK